MAAKEHRGSRPAKVKPDSQRLGSAVGGAVASAITRGYVVGREVLIGRIPGIVVGYNIASFGQFVGTSYPLVVRTALGVTKCGVDELSLA